MAFRQWRFIIAGVFPACRQAGLFLFWTSKKEKKEMR
jgi:hypothetical protein